jgi:hypothetical protein
LAMPRDEVQAGYSEWLGLTYSLTWGDRYYLAFPSVESRQFD